MRDGFGFVSPVASVARAFGVGGPRLPERLRGARYGLPADASCEQAILAAARSHEGLAVLEAAALQTGLAGIAPPVERARVPVRGAVVIALQSARSARLLIALGDALGVVRRDLRVLSGRSLPWLRALGPACIEGVDDAARLEAARAWLAEGGVLIASLEELARPASSFGGHSLLADALASGVPLVPAALTPPPIRRIWRRAAPDSALPPALVFGDPIDQRRLAALDSASRRTRFLRLRLERLECRATALAAPPRAFGSTPNGVAAPIVARGERAWMESEIAALLPTELVVPHERFVVAAVRAPRIPALLREIGRMREIAFREVGEGTGAGIDLDVFDRSYTHLVVWDRAASALAGSYRLAATEDILPVFGSQGLYTSTLFDYAPGFFETLGPALELGRSFVSLEYQRTSTTLLLLWKGIARLATSRPGLRVLFGAVSVSDRYSPESRALLAGTLSRTHGDAALARFVSARRPFRAAVQRQNLFDHARSLDLLSLLVADGEADGRGAPVLVREYAKLGGRFVGWNVDPAFGQALDGLVVVDLARADPRMLAFWLGRTQASAFLARCARDQ